jgi:hypothetical protein
MSAKKRIPHWFTLVVVLAATLAGLHQEAFANGTNAVGNAARTLRDGGAGCAGSNCHLNQVAKVSISRGASFVLPGGTTSITVTASDTSSTTPPLRMGMDVATKKDSAGTNATLSESVSNLLAVNSAEVVHCTATASGCAGPLATINSLNGSQSYTVTFTMPGDAAAGDTHTVYATARVGAGQTGGSWNHATSVQVTAGAVPAFTSPAPPSTGTVGVPYTHTFTASGLPAATIAKLTGSFPNGLNLVNGVLSGTPSATGTFTGTVSASNGVLPKATQNFSITIAAVTVAPLITSAAPPAAGTVGVAYSHTYTATGNPAPTFSVTAGALPTNLVLDPVTGIVTGSPGAAGTFTGTVTASNGVLPNATQNFSITIADVPAVPNYQALWWKPSESGWGINLTHQGNVIFATWFTFGADNAPQWFTMVARNTLAEPNVYSSPISSFSGPPFNTEPFPPNANVRTQVGTGKLTFAPDGKSATFEYTVNGISQVKQIVPQELFPGQGLLPVCAFGTALADLPLAANYQSLWWATHGSDLGGDESGWGINFTHHGNVIFATWFTYDVNGKGWWLFSVAC